MQNTSDCFFFMTFLGVSWVQQCWLWTPFTEDHLGNVCPATRRFPCAPSGMTSALGWRWRSWTLTQSCRAKSTGLLLSSKLQVQIFVFLMKRWCLCCTGHNKQNQNKKHKNISGVTRCKKTNSCSCYSNSFKQQYWAKFTLPTLKNSNMLLCWCTPQKQGKICFCFLMLCFL